MANDAVLQVRIDSRVKSEVEQLYREMGTTFSEAVRMFARQSLVQRKLPFDVGETVADGRNPAHRASPVLERGAKNRDAAHDGLPAARDSGFGMFAAYASGKLREQEKGAWQMAALSKHSTKAQASGAAKAGKAGEQ